MKLTLKIFQLLLLNLLTVTSLFSQTDFKKGYFIDNSEQRVDCYIRDAVWYRNPVKFECRTDSLGKSEMKTIHEVKEFALLQGNKYVSSFSNHEMNTVFTFGLGAGCSYKKFGAELKYYLRRNLTSKYIYLSTDYYTISLSLSYRLFEMK